MQLFENVHRIQGTALIPPSPLQNVSNNERSNISKLRLQVQITAIWLMRFFRNTEASLQPCVPDSLRVYLKRNN